jgi:hypothetical protein
VQWRAKRDDSREKSRFLTKRPWLSGKGKSPWRSPFLSQKNISLLIYPLGRVLKEKPATRLPLGMKLTGF